LSGRHVRRLRGQRAPDIDQGRIRELALNGDADQMRGDLRHHVVGWRCIARLSAVRRNAAERLSLLAENGHAKARPQAVAHGGTARIEGRIDGHALERGHELSQAGTRK